VAYGSHYQPGHQAVVNVDANAAAIPAVNNATDQHGGGAVLVLLSCSSYVAMH
jgi:hypothetical protein